MPSGPSRREWPVAGSRAVNPVACRIVCRRIAYRMARCGGIARRRIACRIARRSMTFRRVRSCLSPDHVSSHPGPPRRPHVSAMLTVGCAEGPSSAMPRPNMACSRRRQPLFTNTYSFVWPWRFIMARSAARLRRIVGPPSPRHVDAEPSGQSERSRITTYHWG